MNLLAIALFGIVCGLVGWRGHLWWCERRMGCPIWLEEAAKKWNVKAELNGWHKREHKTKGPRERHPTLPPVGPEGLP